MRILGVDPALTRTGYGVIEFRNNAIALVEAGIIMTSPGKTMPQRLDKIYRAVTKLIADTDPDMMVLEKIYSHYRHPVTSYMLGQARGVICLASAEQNLNFIEYAATRVKKAIVGNGLASKFQVQRMVLRILGSDALLKYSDVSDALALAIAHCHIRRTRV